MKLKVKTISLTLTNSCNLDCIYCYEQNKDTHSMSYEMATNIISNELMADDDAEMVTIDFFGGEPFLQFDMMKSIYDFIYSREWPKKVSIAISTNGTLVHGDVKEWLYLHRKNIYCGLSFDGNSDMQNYNRSGSFEDIDLDFFSKTWPNSNVKMTISDYSLKQLSDGVIFLHSKGFNVSCNLAYGMDWGDEKILGILSRELMKLIDFYLVNPNVKPCTMLSYDIGKVMDSFEPIRKQCGTGTHMKSFTINGDSYPCQFFMPLTVGERIDVPVFKEIYERSDFDEKCQTCPMLSICHCCYGSSYQELGNPLSRSEGFCRCMKVIMAANSFFNFELYKRGRLDKSREGYILNGIKIIQEYLQKSSI